jgi:hypothetical protein
VYDLPDQFEAIHMKISEIEGIAKNEDKRTERLAEKFNSVKEQINSLEKYKREYLKLTGKPIAFAQ